MIWDRIVFGTNTPKVREKLISEGSALTLDEVVEITWSFKRDLKHNCLLWRPGSSTKDSKETVLEMKHLYQLI